MIDSSIVYGRESLDGGDAQTLLTDKHLLSESCQTEIEDDEDSAKVETNPRKPTHSRKVKSMRFNLISNQRKQTLKRFFLESVFGEQTIAD